MSAPQVLGAELEAGVAGALTPSVAVAAQVVQSLVLGGVREVVIGAGSRSAPFVPVLDAAHRAGALRVRVVLDERSAGFVALGAGRAWLAGGVARPAAVVTTSGTAVANLHPAVAEADAAGVPLLVISADRPHELVGTGASQTTEQTAMFGRAVRQVVDLPADVGGDVRVPGAGQVGAGLRAVAGQVRRALAAACGDLTRDPGPAQVNVRLRPPLALPAGPDGQGGAAAAALDSWACALAAHTDAGGLCRAAVGGPGRAAVLTPTAAGQGSGVPASLSPAGADTPEPCAGLVVAGDASDGAGLVGRAVAELLDWPLLAEPTSGARAGRQALTRYSELLASPAGERLRRQCQRAVVVGHPSLTRPITALLDGTGPAVDVLTTTSRWTDVAGSAQRVRAVEPLAAADPEAAWRRAMDQARGVVRDLGLGRAPAGWTDRWREAVEALPPAAWDAGTDRGEHVTTRGASARSAAEPCADGEAERGHLTAALVAREVWSSCLPAGATGAQGPAGSHIALVVGASMAVRELDRWAPVGGEAPWALANRGLAGIDGTLATATGVWMATRTPVRALVGDLTFLHDAMSLSRGCTEAEPDLQVVVLDDAGGTIFSTLEYPSVTSEPTMRRFFDTAQVARIGALAASVGAAVEVASDLGRLREVLARPVRGLSVVHVPLRGDR